MLKKLFLPCCFTLYLYSVGPEHNAQALEALHDALNNHDVLGIENAIEQGAHVNATHGGFPILLSVIYDASRFTCLAKALRVIRALIDAGADVNVRDIQSSPLSIAVAYDHVSIVQLLIDSGADLELDAPLTRALEPASWGRKVVRNMIIRLLFEAGAHFDSLTEDQHRLLHEEIIKAFKDDPIMLALALGETSQVKDLLGELYHTDVPQEAHESLKSRLNRIFLTAVGQGNSTIIQLMLKEFGKHISLGRGLIMAARRGNMDLVREFSQRSQASRTPLPAEDLSTAFTLAARLGFRDIVQYLLRQDRHTMRINIIPTLDRLQNMARHPGPHQETYQQIYDLLMHEAITRGTSRILTGAQPASHGVSIFQLPLELRQHIASLLPGATSQ